MKWGSTSPVAIRRSASTNRRSSLTGVCRGVQELNVALGGTLHYRVHLVEGKMDHRMPREGDIEHKFGLRHMVRLTDGGLFQRLVGQDEVKVNSLHGQGIMEEGKRIVIEGRAEDDTPEAIHVAEAPGLAIGVQWHAEYAAATDPVNRRLFEAFGAAL